MNSRHAFVLDVNKCTGCHACEVACRIANGWPANQSWREVHTFNELHVPGVELVHLSLACNHCHDAPCMEQCPALAYYRDPVTNAVLINAEACLGCGYCAWVCPYGAPKLDAENGVMTKCTLCNDKVRQGGRPACVTSCPTGALEWREVAEAELTQEVPGFAQARTDPSIRVVGVREERRVPAQATPPAQPPWRALRDRITPLITLTHEWPLAVFTLVVAVLVGWLAAHQWGGPRPDWRVFLASGVVGMGLSAAHLGRSRRAWRAPLHVGRSWLSREVVLFSAFLGLGTAVLAWAPVALWPGRLAVVLGAMLLLAVDRVYGVTRVRGGAAWHSAHVLGTGLLLAAVWARVDLLVLLVGSLKFIFYLLRQAGRHRQNLAASLGLTVPRLGFLAAGVGGILANGFSPASLALILAGEMIDRGLYYHELEIPTPASRQLDELAARPQAQGS